MLNQILSDKEIASQGYIPMTSYYRTFANTKEPTCTERYARWCERSEGLFKSSSYSIPSQRYFCLQLLKHRSLYYLMSSNDFFPLAVWAFVFNNASVATHRVTVNWVVDGEVAHVGIVHSTD